MMPSPDLIHDTALLTISAWQRETSQERGYRLLYRDQARRWAQQDNISNEQFEARLEAVRGAMAYV